MTNKDPKQNKPAEGARPAQFSVRYKENMVSYPMFILTDDGPKPAKGDKMTLEVDGAIITGDVVAILGKKFALDTSNPSQ